jgi:hypothetical protein
MRRASRLTPGQRHDRTWRVLVVFLIGAQFLRRLVSSTATEAVASLLCRRARQPYFLAGAVEGGSLLAWLAGWPRLSEAVATPTVLQIAKGGPHGPPLGPRGYLLHLLSFQ